MNGFSCIFYALLAAFAVRIGARRQRAANKWIGRAAHWSALGKGSAPGNTGLGSRPAPGAAGTDGREPGQAGERAG